MAKLMYEDGDGDKVYIERDIDVHYSELINMFYSLSLGAGYATETVDKYIDCEYNDFAISNMNGDDEDE